MSEQTKTDKDEGDSSAIGCISCLVALGLTLVGVLPSNYWGHPLALGIGVGMLSFVVCFFFLVWWSNKVDHKRARTEKGEEG